MEDSNGNLITNGISNLTIDNGNVLKLTIGNITSTSDIEKIRIVDDETNVTTIPQSGGSMSFKNRMQLFYRPRESYRFTIYHHLMLVSIEILMLVLQKQNFMLKTLMFLQQIPRPVL